MSIFPSSHLEFHRLVVRQEDDGYVVGRMESQTFVEMPEVGVEAIELLRSGATVAQAQDDLRDRHDAEVDLVEFGEELVELGFVLAIDGHVLDPDDVERDRGHLTWLKPRQARWLFGWPVRIAYGLLLLAAALTVVRQPGIVPAPQDFFWGPYVGIVVLVNTLMFSIVATVHELAHLVAARSLGAPARIGFGTRLHYLVMQTDVSGIWSVPRRQRYRVYFAGLFWDWAVIAAALLTIAYAAGPPLLTGLLQALVITIVFNMVMQLQVYMRTDLYFVLLDLLQCRNMFQDALDWARYLAARARAAISRGPVDLVDPLRALGSRERRNVRIYAVVVVFGSAAALTSGLVIGVPVIIEGFSQAVMQVASGVREGAYLRAIDGAATLLVEGSLQILFVLTFVRTHPHWFKRHRTA